MYRILFVDDDTDLLEAAKQYFSSPQYEICCCGTGIEALKFMQSMRLDAIVLDLRLPDMDGFEVCRSAREHTNAPILILSNYGEVDNRILGLRSGADDFLCKPFSFEELQLRIELRIQGRYENRPAGQLVFEDLVIDSGKMAVYWKEKCELLTPIEFDILYLLASHPERIFTYPQIYDAVWKEPINESLHTLQARMAELRFKMKQLCDGKSYIETVRKKGYRFRI